MNSIDIAAEVEEIAICSKVEPSELVQALRTGVQRDERNEHMTRLQGAVNEVYMIFLSDGIDMIDVIEAAEAHIEF